MDPGVVIKLHVESEEPLTLAVVCPLCCGEFEINAGEPLAKTICPGCGLAFTPTLPEPEPQESPAEAAAETAPAEPPTPAPAPADVLDRWLLGEPIKPREVTDAEMLRQWCRNHRAVCGGGLIAAIALVVLSLAALSTSTRTNWLLDQALAARDQAESQRRESELALIERTRQLERKTSLWNTERTVKQELERRLSAAEELARRADQVRKQAEDARELAEREVRGTVARHLAARSEQLRDSHPEHSLLLAAEALSLGMGDGDAPIASVAQYIRDRAGEADGKRLSGHSQKITALAISRDSRWLATASQDNTARLWNLASPNPAGSPIVLDDHQGRVSAAVFSPNDRWLATGSFDSCVYLWNLAGGRPAATPIVLGGHEGRITNLAVTSDSRWLFTASSGYHSDDSELRVWDMAAADVPNSWRVLPGQLGSVKAMAISRNDRLLAAADDAGQVRIWTLGPNGPKSQPRVLSSRGGRLALLAFSSDERWLATASGGAAPNQGAVWLWNLKANDTAAAPTVLSVRGSTVRALSTSGDGRWLAAVGDDRAIRLWDLKADDPASHPHVLDGQSDSHLTAAFSADNRWLATGGGDQCVRLWRIGKNGPEKTPIKLQASQGPIDSLAISPDGHWLITAGDDQTARLWNLRLDELTQFALGTAGGKVSTVEVSPAESLISDRTQVADRQLQLGSPKDKAKLYR